MKKLPIRFSIRMVWTLSDLVCVKSTGRSCDNSAQFAPFFDLFKLSSLLASGAVIFIGGEVFLGVPGPGFLRWIFFRFLLSSLLIL